MKTKISKRAWSLFLALALVVTTVFGSVTTAKAAATNYKDYYSSTDPETGVAGEEQKYSFTHDKSGDIIAQIFFAAPVDLTLSLYNSSDNLVEDDNNPLEISASSSAWAQMENGLWGVQDSWPGMPAGDYAYGVTVAVDAQYYLDIFTKVAEPKISETKATITAGYTKKLSVSDGTVKSWASSKKAVATVDKKGKITAKKAGKAVITATLTDGTKLKCTVTVKANKYTASKLTTSDVTYGNGAMSAYSAAFDKSGNLVVKVIFVNNTSYKVTKLKGIKITVKNGAGATVGTYKLSSKNVSVPAHSTKSFSFTIKKSSLKKKTADLRNSTITCDGTYYYVY